MEGSANNFFFLFVYPLNEVLAVIFIHKVYKKDTGHESLEPTERKGKQKAKKVGNTIRSVTNRPATPTNQPQPDTEVQPLKNEEVFRSSIVCVLLCVGMWRILRHDLHLCH